MSFMKTLITLGAGFAAAKGLDKYQKMGGMAGMRDMMQKSGGTMTDQMNAMAEKMGFPGGPKAMQDMMARFGIPGASADPAGNPAMAGVGGMLSAMSGAAAATGGQMADVFSSMTEGTAIGQIAETNARLMIRAMIQAAKADGEIDEAEKAIIMEHLKDATPEEIAYVKDQLAAPVDPMALARDAGEHSRAQVYSISLAAITVDNVAEVKYLDTLATALGLDAETRDAIHKQMGVTPAA